MRVKAFWNWLKDRGRERGVLTGVGFIEGESWD